MAHYAEIGDDNIVKRVIVASRKFIESGAVGDPSKWLQTSYNTSGGVHYAPNSRTPDGGNPLRKNYAGIGYKYDKDRDAFISPQPYASWLLNETSCCFEPPTPKPTDHEEYYWDEENVEWGEIPKPE
jgi:hypothetical protein|tara:strand:+ start:916 stop:1296 length:381 start_codon:yes stop_codon:yes gene_type:complete